MSCLRNHFQVQGHESVLSCFLEEFKFCYSFSCYIDMYVFDSFWVDLCLWCEIRGLASFFCIWISSCLNTSWWRDCSLLYWIVLTPLPKLSWPKKKGFVFFSTLKIMFHWSVFLSVCQDSIVWCLYLPIMLCNWEVCVLQLYSTFSNIGFVIWALLIFYINFRISLSISTQKTFGVWIEVALNL